MRLINGIHLGNPGTQGIDVLYYGDYIGDIHIRPDCKAILRKGRSKTYICSRTLDIEYEKGFYDKKIQDLIFLSFREEIIANFLNEAMTYSGYMYIDDWGCLNLNDTPIIEDVAKDFKLGDLVKVEIVSIDGNAWDSVTGVINKLRYLHNEVSEGSGFISLDLIEDFSIEGSHARAIIDIFDRLNDYIDMIVRITIKKLKNNE